MSTRIAIYTLRIMGPDLESYEGDTQEFDNANQEVVDNLGTALGHAEDIINDFLPEGFYCKIENA